MRKSLVNSLVAVGIIFALGISANAQRHYDLEKLDVFGSCTKGTPKEQSGKMALSHLSAFSSWQMKEQMQVFHPEYIAWHSSLAGLLEAKPEYREKVPFKNGQWDVESFIPTMAFLAFHNDITKYRVEPVRVDCIGEDSVVLVAQFDGLQIHRDQDGCVTHGVSFGSPVKISIHFKNYQKNEGAPVKKLIHRSYAHLDDAISAQVRDELAKIISGPANMPHDPGSCKTYATILKEFQDQMIEN